VGSAALADYDTIASLVSEPDDLGEAPAEQSQEHIQYLTMVGDRDMILEQLLDLRNEHTQLVEEQNWRAHFGLSLDEDSLHFLKSFGGQEQALLDELEYAELGLEALKQLQADGEALAVSKEASEREPDEDEAAMRDFERTRPSSQAISPPARRLVQSPLYQGILHRKIRLVDHLRGPDIIPVDHGDFINAWLLHRLQSLPRLLGEYISLIETQYGDDVEADDLEHLFLEKWFNDSSAADFAKHLKANLAESADLVQRSLLATAIRPTSARLLRMGPSTTVQDIIDQAKGQ
ncbi:uncharacterized protein PV07_12613, partial [Cladophialophora immunda]